jgi:beta-lactam-binding protein with PASTA domain
MALRIAGRLPRVLVVGIVLLLASATLAVGAAKRLTAVPQAAPAPVEPPTMTVPDLAGQAFVFAKGTLEDTGFAWKVIGPVHGYSVNRVVSQSPPAGTKVRDTGAPTIIVKLGRTSYAEKGQPEDISPYVGTPVQPVRLAVAPVTSPAPSKGAENPRPAAKPKPAVTQKAVAVTARPPAFVVANAPKEPLKEMPLPRRAKLLSAWVASHGPTNQNVRYYLYQHAWVVTGAGFGWWHGADALRELIAADHVAQQHWGIGKQSELVARRALAEVEARTK